MKSSVVSIPDVKGLIAEIREEAVRTARFPVRLILVAGLTAWREVVEHLRLEVDKVLSLSSCCGGNDVYPSAQSITSLIEEHLEKGSLAVKILVLPWAEWLRLEAGQPDQIAFDTLLNLIKREKVGKKRIYIPLFECMKTIKKLEERLSRYGSGELPPIWKITGPGHVEVTVLPFALREDTGLVANGVKAYLECWERGGAEEVTLVTQWAPWLKGYKANFSVEVYPRAYQVLVSRLCSWPQAMMEEWGQEEDWRWLAQESRRGETFDALAARILNVKAYQKEQIFGRWKNLSPHEQWLGWLWSKLEFPGAGYIKRVLERSTNVEQFTKGLINDILKEIPPPEEVRERKDFLQAIGLKELPSAFLEAVTELPDPLHRLVSLWCFTRREKVLAVEAVRELLERERPIEEWWAYLEVVYPELAWYLTVPSLPEPQLQDYFGLYVRSRLRDAGESRLLELARELAKEQPLWKYRPRDQLLEELNRQGRARVVWVDGMGLEWLGVLLRALRCEGELLVDFQVARANLPTITKVNKGWQVEDEVERTVDQEGHQNPYQYAVVLVKQLEAISSAAGKAADLLGTVREVIITSDHGLTRFAKTSGSLPLPDGAQVHKWGRCAIPPSGFRPEMLPQPDCLYHEGWVILLTHEKCCGQAGTAGQVHGGATPEEWLVPVVRVRKPDRPFRRELLKTCVLTPRVPLNVRGEGELRVEIVGYEGEMVQLRIRQQIFAGQRKAEIVWVFGLRGLKGGQYCGVLEGEFGRLAEIKFTAVKGLIEDSLGL
ncbi:MAG: BREX-4 system phosphatase PglZ [Bacillota bacterium]|nr:BREX-4 system phosphatase PglZ [Bacillota bacterium]